MLREGLVVPPMLILSITQECNLACTGCYAARVGTMKKGQPTYHPHLGLEEWRKIIKEARELGVFFFLLAGGEPFLHPGILNLIEEFPGNFFLVFTNGVAISREHQAVLRKLNNVAVILSLEGGEEETDFRRGRGVYRRVMDTKAGLILGGTLAGVSVTITRRNFRYWMEEAHIDSLIAEGIHLGFLMEYIPNNQEEGETLSQEERAQFREKVLEYRQKKRMFLIHSPGDEELVGGCVSAGKGFAHVTPSGFLTPCPVSSLAQHNLLETPLREALSGDFFREIRKQDGLLETEGSPCALFAHREELKEIASRFGAKERAFLS
ncbi:MAG: radical SAM protein [Caldiserica bacterium]|nr:radical SAM protein [Caldisericota bacterium]MDH7562492.1 radical SAM protein [Caldisericota bacterium]